MPHPIEDQLSSAHQALIDQRATTRAAYAKIELLASEAKAAIKCGYDAVADDRLRRLLQLVTITRPMAGVADLAD